MFKYSTNQNAAYFSRPIKMQYSSDQSKRLNLSTNHNAAFFREIKTFKYSTNQNAAFFDQSERNITTNQNVYIFRPIRTHQSEPIRMQYLSDQSTTKIQRETANHNAAFFDRIYISNLRRAVLYASLFCVLQEQYSSLLCILHRETLHLGAFDLPRRSASGGLRLYQ